MKELLEIVQTWSGIVLLLVLAVIGIIATLAGSSSSEERHFGGKDEDHYVLRLPIGRVVFPLILLAAGIVLEFICNFLQPRIFADQVWLPLVIKLGIAVVFGLLFWVQLAKVLRRRVFVNGDKIIVTPAIGPSIETTYKQIRTVANKLAGKDRGVIGKKIRTKEGNRFEVINTMAGYDRFCEQLNAKVELPDLTKKLFKKRDKKAPAEKEPEEFISQEPLPQASPAAHLPAEPPVYDTESEGEGSYDGPAEPCEEPAVSVSDQEGIPEKDPIESGNEVVSDIESVTADEPDMVPDEALLENDGAQDPQTEAFSADEPAEAVPSDENTLQDDMP